MKVEQTPSDLFNADNFLTAQGPSPEEMSEREKALFEEAQKGPSFDPMHPSIPAMHKEVQDISQTSRSHLKENYSREVLAQERAEMGAESLKPSRYGNKVPLAKDVFADIISSGDYREVVEVFKHTWEIRALEQSDILCASDDVRDTSDGQLGYLNSFIFAKLVFAIEGIDGYSIYELFPDILPAKFVNKIDYVVAIKMALRAYLLAFPVQVVDELIEQYNRIEDARTEKLNKLKNS